MKGKEILRGFGTLKGVVAATVRIVDDDPELVKEFQQGEVFVANHPNPSHNFAMKKAAAIITNRGGMTQHAIIMGRQWGIPTVGGTHNATEVLYTGQKVVVDSLAERDEKGRPIGIVYEYIGPGEVTAPPPPPRTPAPPKLNIADKMEEQAKAKGIYTEDMKAFLEKMRERG